MAALLCSDGVDHTVLDYATASQVRVCSVVFMTPTVNYH